ncbi:hypothetical protein ACNKHP_08470 [Shigella boydii]
MPRKPVAGYVLDVLGTKIGYVCLLCLWAVFVVQPRWQEPGVAWLLLVVRSGAAEQR